MHIICICRELNQYELCIHRAVPPSATSGRKRSVLLLAFSVVVALVFQYALAPNYDKFQWEYWSMPGPLGAATI